MLFALPNVTKTEFKNALLKILLVIYEADTMKSSEFVTLLEKMKLKNEKIKQDIDLLLKKSDIARGGS